MSAGPYDRAVEGFEALLEASANAPTPNRCA